MSSPTSNKVFLNLDLPPGFTLKNFIIIILFLVGFYLLLPRIIGLTQTLQLLLHINKFYLVLALAAEIISYFGAAWLLGTILSRLGHPLPFLTRFKLGSISAFTIHFIPISGIGAAAVDYQLFKKQKVDSGSIFLIWILRPLFTYAGFFILFITGLILVPAHPSLSFSPKFISLLIFVLIIGAIFYLVLLYRNKNRFRLVWDKIFNFLNRVLHRFKKSPIPESRKTQIFDDIYLGVGLFGRKKRSSVIAIIGALTYWLGDIICFYFIFLAFGFHIQWGVLLFSYCISTVLGIISAIPGGMGVTEGSLALIFGAMGVPSALALTATLVFRFFSFWLWIPIGFLSYLSLAKKN